MVLRPSTGNLHLRRALVAVAVAVASLGLAGAACSSSPPSGRAADPAATLLLASAAAVTQETAVHLSGTVVERSSGSSVSIAVDATASGQAGDSAGTLDLEGPGMGFTGFTRFIVFKGLTYLNAGAPLWRSLFGKQTPATERLENEILPEVLNHWVELPAKSTDVVYRDTLGLSDPKIFVQGTLEEMKGSLSNAGDGTVDGLSGVQVDSSRGVRVLVARSGPALPLYLAGSQSDAGAFALQLAVTYPAGASIAPPVHAVSLASLEAAAAR